MKQFLLDLEHLENLLVVVHRDLELLELLELL
jgi:hypothetical protein